MSVRVLSASQAEALDKATIAAGTPPRALMQRAGRAAADLVIARFPLESSRGVAVLAGPGNNGGDAWVVAAELARRGIRVRVHEAVAARTPDAIAEREAASAVLEHVQPDGSEGVIVDGLLGTGAHGAPRDAIAAAITRAMTRIEATPRGAGRPSPTRIVALDIPSGVDATSGDTPGAHISADLTVTFGSVKRGLLINRDAAGEIVVVDIGLGAAAVPNDLAGAHGTLVDAGYVRAAVPSIGAAAHKGTRKRLTIIGGAHGMAGSTMLAARGALRSGIGMVKLCAAAESISAVQGAESVAMAQPWPESDAEFRELCEWPSVVLIGPGLGRGAAARAFAERVLREWRGPVVVDADALNAFAGDARALGELLAGRPAVITPHAVEFSRVAGVDAAEVEARRFDIAGELARTVHATVLLKGVPTVVSDGSATDVSASGTPVLATGGSGDVLGGVVATLLAQGSDARRSAAAAAWVHGRAAEIAGRGHVRGVILDDVIAALRDAWRLDDVSPVAPVLAELPNVGRGLERA